MMLFESRRILLGFRIKVLFEFSLHKESSYVFINVSKTPTVKDLLEDIKRRFKVRENVYITLNDCPLLESEDILVLTDAIEVKIVGKIKKNSDVIPLPSYECNTLNHDSALENDQTRFNKLIPRQKRQNLSKTTETLREEEQIFTENDTNRNQNLERRPYSGSIAETIRLLRQNNTETDEKCIFKDSLDGCLEKKNAEIEEQQTVGAEVNRANRGSLDESGDELLEKKRRKRKRKHSKKPKIDFENVEKPTFSQLKPKVFENVNETSRQHIFFENEDECKEPEVGETSSIEQEHIRTNSFDVRETIYCNSFKMDESETVVSNNDDMEINVENERCSEEHFIGSTGCERTRINFKAHPFTRTSFTKELNIDNNFKSTNELRKDKLENNFFNRFNFPNEQKKVNDTSALSEKEYPLATLLMCKQLQTPVEYNLQFSSPIYETRSRSRSRSSSKASRANDSTNAQINNETAEKCQKTENVSSNDECEVLCQFKIVNDDILLRDCNGSWITLTANDASLRLPPLDIPRENQSITFQILYLSQDFCPKMSDLICGKVISFQEESGKLTLNILPTFINALLKDCGEDATLPEELVQVVDNAYEISWQAVKNPRLLM